MFSNSLGISQDVADLGANNAVFLLGMFSGGGIPPGNCKSPPPEIFDIPRHKN